MKSLLKIHKAIEDVLDGKRTFGPVIDWTIIGVTALFGAVTLYIFMVVMLSL